MALDFIPSSPRDSTVAYALSTGSHSDDIRLAKLVADIQEAGAEHKIITVSARSSEGEKLRDFYDIPAASLPAFLIVAPDDSLLQHWTGSFIPSASDIAYHLNRASHS